MGKLQRCDGVARGEKRGEKEDEGEITRCEAARVCGGTEKENIKGK